MIEWTQWHEKHSGKIELIAGIDCWVWNAATGGGGYGRVSYNGSSHPAHRISYLKSKGEIAKGLFVRHLCGNRYCVRPGHLKLGTPADNSRDMAEMFQTHSKLTVEQVRGIRQQYDDGLPLTQIAKNFSIASGSVYPIVCYQNFPYVDPERKGKHKARVKSRFTEAKVAQIKRRLLSGESNAAIARDYGVNPSQISSIKIGAKWKHVEADTDYIAATQDTIERVFGYRGE